MEKSFFALLVSGVMGCGIQSSSHQPYNPPIVNPPAKYCGAYQTLDGETHMASSLPFPIDSPGTLPPTTQREKDYSGAVGLFAHTLVVEANHSHNDCLTPEVLQVNFNLTTNKGAGVLANLEWASIIAPKNYGAKVSDGSKIVFDLFPGIPITERQGFPIWIFPDKNLATPGTVITTTPWVYMKWRTLETGETYEGLAPTDYPPGPKTIILE